MLRTFITLSFPSYPSLNHCDDTVRPWHKTTVNESKTIPPSQPPWTTPFPPTLYPPFNLWSTTIRISHSCSPQFKFSVVLWLLTPFFLQISNTFFMRLALQ